MRLAAPSEVEALAGPVWRDLPDEPRLAGPTNAAEAMADDRRRYLPYDLLVKEDRALMAHGVEGRHPFLDHRVAAAARRLETVGGAGRGRQKAVLRAYVREVVDPTSPASANTGSRSRATRSTPACSACSPRTC
jgi:asparagine synthase (glutamine-hydrolysing)